MFRASNLGKEGSRWLPSRSSKRRSSMSSSKISKRKKGTSLKNSGTQESSLSLFSRKGWHSWEDSLRWSGLRSDWPFHQSSVLFYAFYKKLLYISVIWCISERSLINTY
jgi:hypothetical protein